MTEIPYSADDIEVMGEFFDRGAWLIARGTPKNPKQPLHKWERGGLQTEAEIYNYIADGAQIGLILNTAEMVCVDLDNPNPLIESQFVKAGYRDKIGSVKSYGFNKAKVEFGRIKKDEFRNLPDHERAAILQWFIDHGDKGPNHCIEISESNAGLHWLYRCTKPEKFHRGSPCLEIFGNKKPVFIKDWSALKNFHKLPDTKIDAIIDHWIPVDDKLDRLLKPVYEPRPDPEQFYEKLDGQDVFDYAKYLDSKPDAGNGRNCYLFHWVVIAAMRSDLPAIMDAENWARSQQLPEGEIRATSRSASQFGSAHRFPDPEPITCFDGGNNA